MRQSFGNIAVPGEDRLAGQQVIGNAADRVDVRTVIDVASGPGADLGAI